MNLVERIDAVVELGKYLRLNPPEWQDAKQKAFESNGWFTVEFSDLAVKNITGEFTEKNKLESWVKHYHLDDNIVKKNIGIVMAGNIPMVGFYDFLCVFISGHKQTVKLSSKDTILMKHIIDTLYLIDPRTIDLIAISGMLKGCDGYIATGSGNSARYFDYYFGRYPNIIRRNRTSVTILDGNESPEELELLADDVHQYFGLGCRNVTHVYVPGDYNFEALLKAFNKYSYFRDHTKYRNNFDYHLTIRIMNNQYYMTNETITLVESEDHFAPISELHYTRYVSREEVETILSVDPYVQCVVGRGQVEFGTTQKPTLTDYPDGVDTMAFLLSV